MKLILTSQNLIGLLWGHLSTVHLAHRDSPLNTLCLYEPPPEFPPPIRLSAAPKHVICEYCWFIATSEGVNTHEQDREAY